MSGLCAMKGYNLASSNQRRALMKLIEPFEESIRHINEISNGNIIIADYGSSEGYNAVLFFNQTLPRFREYSDRPILIVHNDLPENKWTEAFKIILEAPESYLKIPDVYFSGIGRSFDQQISPDNSVHIGISSLAFHFIPSPFCTFDHIIASSSSDLAIKSQASEAAHTYLLNLLTQRHKELVNSGRLLIIFPTETLGNLFPAIILQTVHENMYAKGIINDEEKRNFMVPVYARNDEELRMALEEVKNLYRVIEWKKAEDEWRPTEENREELYESLKVLIFSHVETILKKVVKREGVEEIVEEYKKEVVRVLEEIPFTSFPTFHLIVLEKISS